MKKDHPSTKLRARILRSCCCSAKVCCNAAKKFKTLMEDKPEILSVEWTHRHYVKDDEYIPHGKDIEAFLNREIANPIIRWEDRPQLG